MKAASSLMPEFATACRSPWTKGNSIMKRIAAITAGLALAGLSSFALAQRADPDRSANPVTGAGGASTAPATATPMPSAPPNTYAPGGAPANTNQRANPVTGAGGSSTAPALATPHSTGSVSTHAPGNPPADTNQRANPVTGAGGGSSQPAGR
jgi:hypothetical protein